MKLSELKGAPSFAIIPVSRVQVYRKAGKRFMDVFVDEESYVITTKEERKRIEKGGDKEWLREQLDKFEKGEDVEIASEENPLRFSAGGMLWKVGEWYVFLYRDEGAPSYPDHLTIASGLSTSREEILNPSLVMIREALEEIIVSYGQAAVLPIVKEYLRITVKKHDGNPYPMIEYLFPVDGILSIHRSLGYEVTCPYPGRLYYGRDPWTMNIFLSGRKERTLDGIINIDPDTMGIDLLGVLEIPDLDELEFEVRDGEIVNGKPLDRMIYLVHEKDVDGLRVGSPVKARVFSNGKEREEVERSFNITPVTKTILEEL